MFKLNVFSFGKELSEIKVNVETGMCKVKEEGLPLPMADSLRSPPSS